MGVVEPTTPFDPFEGRLHRFGAGLRFRFRVRWAADRVRECDAGPTAHGPVCLQEAALKPSTAFDTSKNRGILLLL
jgi:hypothetical protein